MKLAMRLAILLYLASLPILADSWSGYLVDSNCYDSEEHNVNPGDVSDFVGRDRDRELQVCSPSAKTKRFAVVPADWLSLKFDPAGNAKAAELVRKTGKKPVFLVKVTGERDKNSVKVDSISITN